MASDFGHLKVSRKAYATDPFWNEKRVFSKWEAWEWLMKEASWGDRRRVIGMKVVDLKRGELLASVRFLGEAWGWKRSRVHDYLKLLTDMGRIAGQRETPEGTVYLLVNYDRYQSTQDDEPDADRTDSRTDSGQTPDSERTASGQTRSSKAVKAGKAKKESPPWFDEAWTIYPKRTGGNSRADAERAWRAAMNRGADPKEMLAGTRRYRDYVEADGTVGTKYVKQAATFYGPGEHWAEDWEPSSDEGQQPTGAAPIEMSDERVEFWSQPR